MLHNFEMVFRLPSINTDPLEYAASLFELPGVKFVDADDHGHITLNVSVTGAALRPLAFNLMCQVREKIPGAVLVRFSQLPAKKEQAS